jgi:hypothetical protein
MMLKVCILILKVCQENKNEIQQAIMASYEDYGFERFGMVKLEQHWEIK